MYVVCTPSLCQTNLLYEYILCFQTFRPAYNRRSWSNLWNIKKLDDLHCWRCCKRLLSTFWKLLPINFAFTRWGLIGKEGLEDCMQTALTEDPEGLRAGNKCMKLAPSGGGRGLVSLPALPNYSDNYIHKVIIFYNMENWCYSHFFFSPSPNVVPTRENILVHMVF